MEISCKASSCVLVAVSIDLSFIEILLHFLRYKPLFDDRSDRLKVAVPLSPKNYWRLQEQQIVGYEAHNHFDLVEMWSCSYILYIHASVRASYVHVRMCITLQDPGT